MKTIIKLLSLAVLVCSAWRSEAQSNGQFNLSWSTIDGGGGTSSGGQFSVTGTAGQPDASSPLTSGQFSVAGGFWSFLSVVQTPGAPLLKIKLAGTNAVVSCPLSASDFSLQETTNMLTPWSSTPQPIVDTATEHTITVPAKGVLKVFRLKK